MPKPVMLAGLLGAAVGVPYVVDQSDKWAPSVSADAPAATAELGSQAPNGQQLTASGLPTLPSPGDHLYRSPAPLEGVRTHSLGEVLRMDVSKEWVYSRWARKSTGLADPELFGIRVPLVSGTRMTDVAGSLTYYFNRQGQVERIRLAGTTADTTELVNLVAMRYGLRPAPPRLAGEQLYRVERNGVSESELVTRPESVLWATSPHDSFSVQLEINRPGSGRFVQQKPLQLPGVDTPTPADPLLGQQSRPAGKPVFPGETLVPSSETAAAKAAESGATEAASSAVPKKTPKPALRWPS